MKRTGTIDESPSHQERSEAFGEYLLNEPAALSVLTDIMIDLLKRRRHELEESDGNIHLSYQAEGYVMALGDLYYRITGQSLDEDETTAPDAPTAEVLF